MECVHACAFMLEKIAFRKKGECHKKAIENVSTTHNIIGAFLYHPFF